MRYEISRSSQKERDANATSSDPEGAVIVFSMRRMKHTFESVSVHLQGVESPTATATYNVAA